MSDSKVVAPTPLPTLDYNAFAGARRVLQYKAEAETLRLEIADMLNYGAVTGVLYAIADKKRAEIKVLEARIAAALKGHKDVPEVLARIAAM